MRLYNTLTRQEEDFSPAQGDTVRLYACGLTVYARGHIGNFRTFVAIDLLRRTLEYEAGFRMRHVMNFTDVDDRTIAEANTAGVPLREYTDQFIRAYLEDAGTLGLEDVEERPRATDEPNLRAMSEMVSALEQNGHTYRTDGSIYFRISTLPSYGKLARLDHAGIKPGARIDADKYDKENARDFVLWKATQPGEPTWDFGVGPGRPGWHIECSAMALRLLDPPPIDIHCGGVDLVFPHHENEIAQAEGATKREFARLWFHVEHLLMDDGEKMSKSLGNIFTVQDVLAKGFRASTLRYQLLSVHYRKQLKFSWASLAQSEEGLRRLMDFLGRLERLIEGKQGAARAPNPNVRTLAAAASEGFGKAMLSDLNVSQALSVLFDLVRDVNVLIDSHEVNAADAVVIRDVIERADRVLGVISLRRAEEAAPPVPVDEIQRLVEERRQARQHRDFERADAIRKDLAARGVLLEDSPTGTTWKRA
jgi:cysteinyl-tRNA synthetase